MSYKELGERAKRTLLGLLLRYAEHAKSKALERAARAIIEDLL